MITYKDLITESFTQHVPMSKQDLVSYWSDLKEKENFSLLGPGQKQIRFIRPFRRHVPGDVIKIEVYGETDRDINCITKHGKIRRIPKSSFELV
jgi:hypothetical protein